MAMGKRLVMGLSSLESFWHDTSVWRTVRQSDRIYHS